MSRLITTAACGLLLFAAPAMAQEWRPDRGTIQVIGEGRVQAAPDRFSMTAAVQGHGVDQTEALRNMTTAQTAVTTAVTRLDGLTWSEFSTGLPSVQPVHPESCRGYGRSDCEVIGYVASMSLTLRGAPAERAGDAVSLAAERGARNSQVSAYALSDDSSARRGAARAAFADARRQAEDIAGASGQRIVRISRVTHPHQGDALPVMYGFITAVAAADSESPAVGIPVSPEPITVESRLDVEFEVE